MKKNTTQRFLTTILFIAGVVTVGLGLKFYFTPIVSNPQGLRYNVQFGATTQAVIADLTHQQIIQHPIFFRLLVRLRGNTHYFKAGEYFFPPGTTPPKMLNQMLTGSGIIYHSFAIISGWNFNQLRQALLEENDIRHTIQNMTNAEIMQRLGHPNLHPEGQFFPDTYYYVLGSSDIALLKRAFHTMQNKLNEAWKHRAANLPFHYPYDALIAASLVEKEAYLDKERPIIAGVMVNRLKHNMLLQFDPTVIYGMGLRFDGKIHKANLTENTPYNTYVKKGLPPTPIAMPSLLSLMAVVHPANHEFFYFVARGDGSHQFSVSLNQHHEAVLQAKIFHPWYFNANLVKEYLLIVFSKKIFGELM